MPSVAPFVNLICANFRYLRHLRQLFSFAAAPDIIAAR
jgi:hypothetical protein